VRTSAFCRRWAQLFGLRGAGVTSLRGDFRKRKIEGQTEVFLLVGVNSCRSVGNGGGVSATQPPPNTKALTIQSETIEIRSSDDIERALETATTRGVEAGIVLQSPLAFNTSKQFAELAIAKRLPLISLFAEFPKSGPSHCLRAEPNRVVPKMRGLRRENLARCQAK
jgi:hypothetical protein